MRGDLMEWIKYQCQVKNELEIALSTNISNLRTELASVVLRVEEGEMQRDELIREVIDGEMNNAAELP